MTTPQWSLPRAVALDQLGSLGPSISAEAGQSVSISPLLDHPGYLAKLYKVHGDPGQAGRLDRLIGLPDTDPDRLEVLRRRTSWPVARIRTSGGGSLGCVIPQAPSSYRVSVGAEPTRRTRYLEVDLLAKPNAMLQGRGLPGLTVGERLQICRSMVQVAAVLERLDLVYSDWSYSNAFWSAADTSAFVIDIDGCAWRTGENICQPNWEDPLTPRSRPADTFVERYRVALLVARCLTGRRALPEVVAALTDPSDPLCSAAQREALLDMILLERREQRPSIVTLQAVLDDGPYIVFPDRRRMPVPALVPTLAIRTDPVPPPSGPNVRWKEADVGSRPLPAEFRRGTKIALAATVALIIILIIIGVVGTGH